MGDKIVERVVHALSVAMMNAQLYFTEHRRVVEATEEAVTALDEYFVDHPQLVLSIREGLIIFDGTPLFDLSLNAHRLIKAIKDHVGWGLSLTHGVTAEELRAFLDALKDRSTTSAAGVNSALSKQGISRVTLDEKPIAERSALQSSDAQGGIGGTGTMGDWQISREVYTNALTVLQEITAELHRSRKVSFAMANEVAENLVNALHDNRDSFIVLTAAKDYDAYTFNHSVNVCIYASTVGEVLSTRREDVVDIAQAALLHDLGKLMIADEIIHKTGKLSDAEWEIMRQHTVMGAKILMESGAVSEVAVNVAFGHHLRHDLSGYPKLSNPIKVDPVTELVNVIDVYEAVTARRPYKKPFPPEKAADLLLKGAGTEFNPHLVEAFIRCFGIYPVGTEVRLDDGTQGQVVAAHPEDPARPQVRVTHGPDGEPLESPETVDTAEKDRAGGYRRAIEESLLQEDVESASAVS